MTFSDDMLMAYLQGTLGKEDCDAIETAVADDPELESRLMALDPIAPIVREVFQTLPAEDPEIELPVTVPVAPMGWWQLLGVAAATAVLAVSLTFWLTRPQPMGWAEQAALYQSLYTPDSVATLEYSPTAVDAQILLAEKKLGRGLNLDALEELPGLELKGAQVLSFRGKPLVQIVYADAQGNPFALCVIRQGEGAPNRDLKQEVLSGLATARWARNGYGYMVLGDGPDSDLTAQIDYLAEAFAS
ncbi:MAG: hypothetical protein ACWA49_08240 [Ruegeria sp.]